MVITPGPCYLTRNIIVRGYPINWDETARQGRPGEEKDGESLFRG